MSQWDGWPACPCGCGEEGLKLNRFGHLARTCSCASCRGRNNRSRGRKNQTKGHRALGGDKRWSPSDEESVGGYDVRVQVEWKTGKQVPANFRRFVETEWLRRAMSQANRARRIGDGSMPAVGIDGKWLIVQLDKDQDGAA